MMRSSSLQALNSSSRISRSLLRKPTTLCTTPVSYTHLDVYKRQQEGEDCSKWEGIGKGSTVIVRGDCSYDKYEHDYIVYPYDVLIVEQMCIRDRDKVVVDYYGAPTPIQQLAAVAVSEARTLTITPWDRTLLRPISKAIMASDVGITPIAVSYTHLPVPGNSLRIT